jgi:hypothetical protein
VRRNDLVRIAEAREHLEILRSHLTRGDLDDAVVFDAVCLRLAAAIECVGAVDAAVRDDVFGTSWPVIASVRNRPTRRTASDAVCQSQPSSSAMSLIDRPSPPT